MITVLPPNLKAVAAIASDAPGRSAHNAIRLAVRDDGKSYAVDATDCRKAIRVEGERPASPDKFPSLPGIDLTRTSAASVLVLAKHWQEAFEMCPKGPVSPKLRNIVAQIAPNECTFAATDLDRSRSVTARAVEGRFPDLGAVMPKKAPLAVVNVDAKLLADLLRVVLAFTAENDTNHVTIEMRRPQDAIVIRVANASQKITAMLATVDPPATAAAS